MAVDCPQADLSYKCSDGPEGKFFRNHFETMPIYETQNLRHVNSYRLALNNLQLDINWVDKN